MKKFFFFILLSGFLLSESMAQEKDPDLKAASISDANTASVDALGTYIKQNFNSDSARLRAIYVWITNHINYDVPRLLARENNPNSPPQPIEEVLSTRNAVCQGYSDLFVALCQRADINAIVVNGYTKFQGKISPVGHAWVAASLNGEWWLFDPTWGAGYVRNDRFVKRFSNDFYKVPPSKLIADHMPFDPMYQFLSYPLSPGEFRDGKQTSNQTLFQFKDSLSQHVHLSKAQQMSAELRRLEAAGIQNDMLRKRALYLKNSLESFSSKDAFEEGSRAFKSTLALYKDYMGEKSKQFSAISDNDLRTMVDSMFYYLRLSRSMLSEAIPKTDAQRQAKAGNMSNIDRLGGQLTKEKQFVDQYLAADLAGRKQLFGRR
jgi:hypothetical protein